MQLNQFKFKKSFSLDFKEESKVVIGLNSYVQLFRNENSTKLKKVLDNRMVYNVDFLNNEEGKQKLEKALKNISKRK